MVKDPRETTKYMLSEPFQKHLERMANIYIGGRKNIKYVMEHPTSCPRTNNEIIWYDSAPAAYINQCYSKEQAIMCVAADVFHERAHTRWTVFQVIEAIRSATYNRADFEKYHPLLDAICEYTANLSPYERKAFGDLNNVVEDSAIEYCAKKTNKFVEKCIVVSNAIIFSKTPSLSKLVEDGASDYDILFHACMDYAIIGGTKGRIPEKYREIFINSLMPLLKQGRLAEDSFIRFEITKKVFEILVPYLKDKEKAQKENGDNKYTENYPKSSSMVSGGDCSEMPLSNETRQRANEMNNPNNSPNSESKNGENGKSSNANGEKSDISDGNNGNSNSTKSSDTTNEENSSNKSATNGGQSDDSNDKRDGISSNDVEDGDEQFEYDEELFGNAGMSASELRDTLGEIKTSLKKVDKEYATISASEHRADMEELDNMNIKIKYPNELHASCKPMMKMEYIKSRGKEEYLEIAKKNKHIIDVFVRAIQVAKANRKEKTRYTIHGKLAQEKLYKVALSQKTYKKTIPAKHVDKACVLVELDLSGSMQGERLKQAIAGTIILIEACEQLDIPIAVVGHNASYPTFNMYWFKRFESKRDKYSLPSAIASHCNRDGLALLYGVEILKRRPEPNKIFFHITDGQPSDSGYSGTPAKKDMLEIEKMVDKSSHIKICGVAISGNKTENDAIQQCYLKSISVEDLKTLGRELLSYIKPML